MADIRLEYLKELKDQPGPEEPAEGSRKWLGANLTMIAEVCAKYAFLTGSDEFNELFNHEQSENFYAQYRADKNIGPANDLLRGMAESLRYYYPAYTSEVRWTDRVFRFPVILTEPAVYSEPLTTVSNINNQILFSMLTGEPSSGRYFPINAVRWMTLPRDIAILVNESDFDWFEAELFHFGTSPRKMEAELYLLDEGRYTLSIIQKKTKKVLHTEKIRVENKPVHIDFDLPSRELCILKVN
jgi:hypothetical protein